MDFDLTCVALWHGNFTTSTNSVHSLTSFFRDPVLSEIKLIAEPWDLGQRRVSGLAIFLMAGRNGTENIVTRCGGSGQVTEAL